MNSANLILVLSSVFLNSLAQIFIKYATSHHGPISSNFDFKLLLNHNFLFPISVAIFLYISSLFLWIIALSYVDVSKAFPMQSLGFIFVCFMAWMLFDEPITILRLFGIFIIIIGIFFVSRS